MAEALRRCQLTMPDGGSMRQTRLQKSGLARVGPPITLFLLFAPVMAGLAGTALPAFGIMPGIGGGLTLDVFAALFETPGIVRSSVMAGLIALITTLVSISVIALFTAGFAGTSFFNRMRRLVSPLLSVPHAAAAFGLAFLIAPSGILMRLFSPWATGFERPPDILIVQDPLGLTMMAGLIVKEIPFLFLITLAALPQTPHASATRLARSLGYGRTTGFLLFVWPQVYRQIRLGVFAVVAYASSVVDVALILGPSLPPVLPVRLIQWMNDPELETRLLASAGALLQLGVTLASLLAWIGIERMGRGLRTMATDRGLRFRSDGVLRGGAAMAMGVSAITVLAGITVLAIWSVAGLWQFPDALPKAFTLRSWSQTLPRIGAPLGTTIIAALAATLIAVLLSLMCLEREFETGRGRGQRGLLLIYVPLIVPQISFLFGLQVLAVWSGLDGTYVALILSHFIFVLPYVFLALSDPWRALDPRFDRMAAGLGMRRTRALLVMRLPMLLRPILTAAAIGIAVSAGQYLPTVLIGAGRLTTITSEAVALASGGNRRVIGVWAFLQAVLPLAGFAIATALPALLWRNRRSMKV